MTRRKMGIVAALSVLAMLVVAVTVGNGLPDDVLLPTHWGVDGEADGFSDKWTALLMPVLLATGVSLLFYFLPSLEPRREGLARSQSLYLWAWAAVLLMSATIELVVLSEALGWRVPVNHVLAGAVGVMLLLIGNQLGKSRSMYMVGIRTPWTLASEEVWIKTHRLGGKLIVLAGLLMIAAALLPVPPEMLPIVVIAGVVVGAVVPVAYSFILWRREQLAQPSE